MKKIEDIKNIYSKLNEMSDILYEQKDMLRSLYGEKYDAFKQSFNDFSHILCEVTALATDCPTFEYKGYTFQSLNIDVTSGKSFKEVSAHLYRGDLGINSFGDEGSLGYNHAEFYELAKAAGGADSDLFLCLNNGKVYIPCYSDLQEYRENK